jgi:putative transposase
MNDPNPISHGRQSICLPFFEYSRPGSYFLTICANRNQKIFGRVFIGDVILSPAGKFVRQAWLALPKRFLIVVLHDLVVMPNHFHGILQIAEAVPRRGAASNAPTAGRPTLGEIVRAFKSTSAIGINWLLGPQGERVWQKNYYEHIIRDDQDFAAAQKYIHENPQRWEFYRSEPELRW